MIRSFFTAAAIAFLISCPGGVHSTLPNNLVAGDTLKTYAGDRGRSDKNLVYLFEARKWISEKSVNSMLHEAVGMDGVIFYNWRKYYEVTASAPGVDDQHHLVNSYLVGYRPFTTGNIFVPWQTLAKRKKYQMDHISSNGREEIWQNSRQAYQFTRGDCEDHAIALADWLIDMGHDARVVIGNYKGNGHAWVVLLKNGRTFLLESTRKKRLATMRSFPLAKLQTGYQPEYMFNRTHFWKNTGSVNTFSYTGTSWVRKSRMKR